MRRRDAEKNPSPLKHRGTEAEEHAGHPGQSYLRHTLFQDADTATADGERVARRDGVNGTGGVLLLRPSEDRVGHYRLCWCNQE